jgi:NAD(P)-dependent dehydrogenase (short-subunit alcohol dehydrogenase family)
MARLQGRRALVTGASSGIGAAAAQMLAREGADVALLARGDGLEEVAASVAAEGSRAVQIHADVGYRDELERAIEAAVRELGGLDIVMTSAAAGTFGRFDELPASDFDRCLDVTFRGTVDTIRVVLPHLERSGGTLVVMGSAVDTVPLTLMSAYVAAKGALASFIQSLRSELRASGSEVSLCEIRPGPVDTPFWRHLTHPEGLTPPSLPPLTSYTAESVARTAVACAIEPRESVTVGGAMIGLAAVNRFARPVAEQALSLMAKVGRAAASFDDVPSALWSSSGDGTVEGGLGGRPSLWTALRLRGSRPDGLD